MFDFLIKDLKSIDREVSRQNDIIRRHQAKIAKAKARIANTNLKRQDILLKAYGQIPQEAWHKIDIAVYRLFKLYNRSDKRLANIAPHNFNVSSVSISGEKLKFDIRIDGDTTKYSVVEHNSVFNSFENYFTARLLHVKSLAGLLVPSTTPSSEIVLKKDK